MKQQKISEAEIASRAHECNKEGIDGEVYFIYIKYTDVMSVMSDISGHEITKL